MYPFKVSQAVVRIKEIRAEVPNQPPAIKIDTLAGMELSQAKKYFFCQCFLVSFGWPKGISAFQILPFLCSPGNERAMADFLGKTTALGKASWHY